MPVTLPIFTRRFIPLLLACAATVAVVDLAEASISLATLGSTYSQDFDTLASSGSSSVVPNGWEFVESFPNANTVYVAGTGSSNAGDTYSFGASGSTERALGTQRVATVLSTIGASFANDSGTTIESLSINYTGEQWRLGLRGRNDRLDFQYSLDATSLLSGTWIDFNPLDFIAPQGTVSPIPNPTALNGNADANRTLISNTIAGLSIASGDTFWIRWSDFNASDPDDGLAIDDFSLMASGASSAAAGETLPEASALLTWLALCGCVLAGVKRDSLRI